MSSHLKYDVAVFGTGPAGEGAAINAAKSGKRVLVVERMPKVGGACTHTGTIPSKALRYAAKQILDFNDNPIFTRYSDPKSFSFSQLLKRAEDVIRRQVGSRVTYYANNRIDIVYGEASFVDEKKFQVELDQGVIEHFSADSIVIATGSRPYQPSDVDFTHPRIFDSDSILELQHTPRSMIVYGAGVIGSEYASIFSSMRARVDLINNRDSLLSFMDDEISDALSYHLRQLGVLIRHNEEYDRVEGCDDGVILHLKSGKKIKADCFLWCNGRTGNTQNLNLEAIGLSANSRGQLDVDKTYETAVKGVYAVGDVIGWPSLASAALDQGRSAATKIIGEPSIRFVDDVPSGIYTIPEISSIGKTEAELTSENVPYEVGRAFFKHMARAQITGNEAGMLKILFHRETYEILGIHCFGDQASEIVHIGQVLMKTDNNDLRFFINNTFNYPTMAEAYRVAAFDGLNRVF